MTSGVLERIDEGRYRLTVEYADGEPADVFEGPLALLLDVMVDLGVELIPPEPPDQPPGG